MKITQMQCRNEIIQQIHRTLKEKHNEFRSLHEVIRVTSTLKQVHIQEESEIWREINQKISIVQYYVMILTKFENGIVKSANLQVRNIFSILEERFSDVDHIIDFVNTLQNDTLAHMNLPKSDKCIFSLCMIKENHNSMLVMKEEFKKASKEIGKFGSEWNYLGRFKVSSFWAKYNWLISKEEFHNKLKDTKQDHCFLSIISEEVISPHLVINTLCMDFTIFPIIEKLVQSLPEASYQFKSHLLVVVTKHKNTPWLSLDNMDKLFKFMRHLNQNMILEQASSSTQEFQPIYIMKLVTDQLEACSNVALNTPYISMAKMRGSQSSSPIPVSKKSKTFKLVIKPYRCSQELYLFNYL